MHGRTVRLAGVPVKNGWRARQQLSSVYVVDLCVEGSVGKLHFSTPNSLLV